MLENFKLVMEIVEKLVDRRGKEREQVGKLLLQISDELTDLAKQWQEICQGLEKSANFSVDKQLETEASKLVEDLDVDMQDAWYVQRSRYAALFTFVQHGAAPKRWRALSEKTAESIFDALADALSIKGHLIGLVKQVIYPGDESVFLEMPYEPKRVRRDRIRNLESTEENHLSVDEIIARHFKWTGSDLNKKEAKLRHGALSELRVATETLTALAGEFRATVALYNAGQLK